MLFFAALRLRGKAFAFEITLHVTPACAGSPAGRRNGVLLLCVVSLYKHITPACSRQACGVKSFVPCCLVVIFGFAFSLRLGVFAVMLLILILVYLSVMMMAKQNIQHPHDDQKDNRDIP